MEEIRENENPEINAVPVEMMPPFVTPETTVKNEVQENVDVEVPEGEPDTYSSETVDSGNEEKPVKEDHIGRFILDLLMIAAIIVLFVLHFCGGKKAEIPVVPEGTPGNGDIVYVNIDTINEQYKLVSLYQYRYPGFRLNVSHTHKQQIFYPHTFGTFLAMFHNCLPFHLLKMIELKIKYSSVYFDIISLTIYLLFPEASTGISSTIQIVISA